MTPKASPTLVALRSEALRGTLTGYHGTFTLALEKAREKMKNFQLPDPRYYILQLIQAIVASGARTIDVTHESTPMSYRITIGFDGPGYTREELEHLYDHLFSSQGDRARDRLRELALGIASCQALQPKFVQLVSGTAAWQRTATAEAVVEIAASLMGSPHRLEIQGQGLDIATAASAVELISSHCSLVPIPVRVNDVLVNVEGGAWAGSCPWPAHRFRKGEMFGMLGLPYETAAQSILQLLRYGVLFTRRGESRLHPPVSVVCENPRLRKNASQMDVVEDSEYLSFVEDMQQILMDFALDFGRQRIPRYHKETVHEFLVRHFEDWLSAGVVLSDEPESRDLESVLNLPMFHDLRGHLRTLREVVRQYRGDGFLSLCKQRMPYAPVQNWVVLNPTDYEERLLTRLFGQIRWVDKDIYNFAGAASYALTRVDVSRDELAVNSLLSCGRLAQLRVSVGFGHYMTLALLDDYPDGTSNVVIRQSSNAASRVLALPMRGLDVLVEIYRSRETDEELLRKAQFAIVDNAPRLYGEAFSSLNHLLAGALRSVREERLLAHLLSWWSWRLDDAGVQDASPAEVRSRLGAEVWNVRVFMTRAGLPVSLADIDTWLAHFDTLTVATGGRRHAGDHALDSSPAVMSFLSRVFGPKRFQRATLKAALLGVREKQATLSRASEHPDGLVIADAPDEEEELLALLDQAAADLEAARVPSAEDAPSPVSLGESGCEVARGDGEADTASAGSGHEAAQALTVTGDGEADTAACETSGTPLVEEAQVPAYADPQCEPSTDGDGVTDAIVPADGPVGDDGNAALAVPQGVGSELAAAWMVQHAFSQGGLMGQLGIPLAAGSAEVAVCRDARVVARRRLFGLPVGGWIHADEVVVEDLSTVAWTPEQEEILRGQIRLLFDGLAQAMRSMEPAPFTSARVVLMAYLRFEHEAVRERIHVAAESDPLVTLPFLPTSGGTLASLRAMGREVFRRRFSRTHPGASEVLVCERNWVDPDLDTPVAVLEGEVDAQFYRTLFGCPLRYVEASDRTPHERLLSVVRRELRILRDHGDFRVTDEMLARIIWKPRTPNFISHDPESGVTSIDPAHGVVRTIVRTFETDRRLVPVLVSSVYTAINRALDEIRDDHEVAFLEALLLSCPGEGSAEGR